MSFVRVGLVSLSVPSSLCTLFERERECVCVCVVNLLCLVGEGGGWVYYMGGFVVHWKGQQFVLNKLVKFLHVMCLFMFTCPSNQKSGKANYQ